MYTYLCGNQPVAGEIIIISIFIVSRHQANELAKVCQHISKWAEVVVHTIPVVEPNIHQIEYISRKLLYSPVVQATYVTYVCYMNDFSIPNTQICSIYYQ